MMKMVGFHLVEKGGPLLQADMCLGADIYGASETKTVAPALSIPSMGPKTVSVAVSDTLQSYGSIRSLVMGLWDDEVSSWTIR